MAYGRYGLESFDCTCHNKEVYARLELIRFTRNIFICPMIVDISAQKEISEQTCPVGHYEGIYLCHQNKGLSVVNWLRSKPPTVRPFLSTHAGIADIP